MNEISNTSFAIADSSFRDLESKWHMVDSLWGGTDGMRDAGEIYLPRAQAEKPVDYTNRLKHSVLFNYYKEAVMNTVLHLTSKDINFENLTPEMEDFFTNVDLEGRDIDQFNSDMLTSSIHYGISYVLVDYTATNNDLLSDAERPYWVNINIPQVLSFKSERINANEVLTYFKFKETSTIDMTDPTTLDSEEVFTDIQYTDQIREYILEGKTVRWNVWRRSNANDGTWDLVDGGIMEGIDRIPIVPIYSHRISFYMGSPTFLNLAELNVRHWQSYSDQSNLLHYARFPILFAKGIDNVDENGIQRVIEIGANTVQYTSNPNAELKFVEHTGSAVESGWKDLDKLENEMKMISPTPLEQSVGMMTATQAVLESTKALNILQSLSRRYETALTQLLALTSVFYGLTTIPSVTIVSDQMRNASIQPPQMQQTSAPAQDQTETING
jgi:hypothetical protein